MCGTKTEPVLAELHYHAGRAYEALGISEKTANIFVKHRSGSERIFGRLARVGS